jgi:hypothetical protein
MKLSDVQDPESFLYAMALNVIASRYKVGDYVKLYEYEYDDDDKRVWVPETKNIAAFRSRVNSDLDLNARIVPIYRVTLSTYGYIEVEPINPAPENELICTFFNNMTQDVTGYNLRSTIEDLQCDMDDDEEFDCDAFINNIVDNMMKLDEDYTDSIIFETQYVPYSNAEDIQELVKKVYVAREQEQKELLRLRALKGHATRKRRKEAEKAKVAKERNTIILDQIFSQLVSTKKVSKKRVFKKTTKKVSKVATKRKLSTTRAKKR